MFSLFLVFYIKMLNNVIWGDSLTKYHNFDILSNFRCTGVSEWLMWEKSRSLSDQMSVSSASVSVTCGSWQGPETGLTLTLLLPSGKTLNVRYNHGDQIWAQSWSDWPQMGQTRVFFKDQIQYIAAHRAKKYWILSQKVPDLSHLSRIWPTLGPNLVTLVLVCKVAN